MKRYAMLLVLTGILSIVSTPAFSACIGGSLPIDTFDDGVLGPWWQATGSCGTPAESGGWAVLTKTAGCVGTVGIRLPASTAGHAICGDFDIRVDFDITGWPAASTQGGRFNPLLLYRADTGALLAGVERYRESPNSCIPFADSYKMYTTDPGCQDVAIYIATSDMVGKFRLVREGTTIRGYYWAGTGWVLGMTRTVPSVDVFLVLNTGTNGTLTSGHTSRFDNLYAVSPLGETSVQTEESRLATWTALKTLYR